MIRAMSVPSALLVLALLASPAQARITVEAVPGVPFGVGRIIVPLAAADANTIEALPRMLLTEADGRVLYPAISVGKFRQIVGEIFGAGGDNALPGQVTAYFLFTGSEPLRLTFYTPAANTVVATPRAVRGRNHERLLTQWWREYQRAAEARASAGEVPPLIDAYLTTMLAQRLQLPLNQERAPVSLPRKTLDLLMGIEKLRAETMRETLLSPKPEVEAADQPLPAGIDWGSFAPHDPPAGVIIEPIALHVPMECFYVRFGKFSNYLWLDNLTEEYGGDLANMATLRGQDLGLGERVQTQLCLEKNKLAELFGDTVIADVAMLGQDIYTHEGAAIGMLFQARNTQVLNNDFAKTRAGILKREAERGATEETIRIAGHDVSYLSTPDNRLRSFYAIDGDFHLITTSHKIVERFYAAGAGRGALGTTEEFQHARSLMPTERNDTIFVYFSSALFQNLVGPQYQIELARRLQAVTDIELIQLARLAAQGENKPAGSLEELIAGGFLPRGFGRRADGSGPIVDAKRIVDSKRGARGSFTPIPDVELQGVTRGEAARYAQLAEYLRTQWTNMDPLMIGLRRFKLNDEGLERVTVDAYASPFDGEKYGWITSILGPPAKQRVLPVPGDIVHLQAVVQGGLLNPGVPPHHMFLGVQDHVPLANLQAQGLIAMLQILRASPGYLGAWPRPGTLDRLPLALIGPPDRFGFSQLPFGMWRRTVGPWSVLGFDPLILGQVSEQLEVEDTDNPAQVRLHVGDLAAAKTSAWVKAFYHERARQTSVANAALLQHVVQQLKVSPPQAKSLVETLLDAKLVCQLGGEYQPVVYGDGVTFWESTAWRQDAIGEAGEYQAALLQWFRGLDADFTQLDNQLRLRAQLDMQRKPTEAKLELPTFNLPNIFGDFGKTSKPKKVDPQIRPESLPTPRPDSAGPRREF
jgi:hypothetical protein